MAGRRQTTGPSPASLIPMIIGIAFALAAIALLAFFVLPSKGQGIDTSEIDNSTAISAPDVSQLLVPTETPRPDHTPRVNRLSDPLVIEATATATSVASTDTPEATSTSLVLPGFKSTPRVIGTRTPVPELTA